MLTCIPGTTTLLLLQLRSGAGSSSPDLIFGSELSVEIVIDEGLKELDYQT